ncbi:hypothetical protein BURKHO8Y_10014 [Burkholderia sp. 8Y]|nr:hypothetical protein BURKHO8Y_10014 [Burkholderia sp. 8Y]
MAEGPVAPQNSRRAERIGVCKRRRSASCRRVNAKWNRGGDKIMAGMGKSECIHSVSEQSHT